MFGTTDFLQKVFKQKNSRKSKRRQSLRQRKRFTTMQALEDRRVLAAIYDADFSTPGAGFADHTTSSPPAAGPATSGVFGAAPNAWELSYVTTPSSDTSANEFSVEASTQGLGGNVLQSNDWGGQGIFESQNIDVSSLSTVSVAAVALGEGTDFINNQPTEFFQWFYRLDGVRTDSTTYTDGTADTGADIGWSIPSLNVAGVTNLVVGFEFNINGADDGFEVASIVVDDLGGGGAAGVTVTPTGGSNDVAETGTTSDMFDVVLNAAPTSDVTISLATPDGETSVSPSALTFTAANFSTAQTVTVTAVDDSDEEGDHTGNVTVAVASGDAAYNGLAVPDVVANIADNDVTVDLIITGVMDGPLTGGSPKVVELYALDRIDDLSVYGLGSANNGGAGGTSELTLSGSVNAGNYIYVTTSDIDFDAFFGTTPTDFGPVIVNGAAPNVNGDDAIELFKDVGGDGFSAGDVVDVFGEVGVSGTGTAWEYLDGWAYRNDLTSPSTTFAVADWSFSGIDALDGETLNSTAATPFPIAQYDDSTAKEIHILSGIDGTNVTEGGATDDFGVVLNAAPTADVTITLGTADGETTVSPTTLTFTPANFATPQSVTVTAVNDTDVEGGHTGDVTFAVSSSDSGYNGATVLDEEISIADDDASFAINELRISHSTLDDVSNNFVEIYETSGAASIGTSGLHLLVLSGEFSPGSIDFAIDLSGGSTDGDGFLLVADDGTTVSTDVGDLIESNLDFFGSPTTFLLVSGFTGSVGQDLDDGSVNGDNDGTLDVTPWTAVLDAVSLDDADATPDANYATAFGGPTVLNPAGNGFTVAAISARPDGTDMYEASVGLPSDPFTNTTGDTPGFSNVTLVSVTQSDDYTGVIEGGATDTLEFVLDQAPTADVTITLSTADGETSVSSSSLTFTPANFSTPQSVTVTAVDDSDIEGSPHTGVVGITVSSADTTFDGNFVPDVNVSIADNDGGSGSSPLINEFRTSHINLDNASNNFIEIHDAPSTSIGNLSLVVISERFAPGVIDFAFNLVESGVAGATDAAGFFLLHDDGFNSIRYTIDPGDIESSGADFFGSASTYLLVDGFHGSQGLDLDDNNDGVLDSTPWSSVIDAVTIDDANFVAAGYGNSSAQFLTLPVLPNVPSGVRRRVDGGTGGANGGFDVLQYNDDNADTPGATNVLAAGVRIIDISVAPGDLNGDTIDDPGTQANIDITENGVTDSFGVVLDAAPTSNVTITFTTADGETSVSPLTFTPSNWFVEQTATVSAVDDTDIEGDHTGVIGLSITSADAAYSALTPPSLIANIVDNDAADNRFSVVINEIHNDPAPISQGLLAGDANGDGVTESGNDEFIEIVNTDSSSVDISGWTVSDSVSVRHTFPAATILLPGQAVVVFGGGTPTGSFGGSVVQTASSGLLGFGAADSAILSDGSQTIDMHTWAVDDGIDDGVDNSLARIPDFTGNFVDQGSEDGFVTLWTPGVSNVLPFSAFSLGAGVVVTSTGSLAVTEGGATDSFDVALSAAPTADVTITIAPDAQTTTSATSLTFTPANFSTPQSVTITAVDDVVVEGGHSSTITLTSSSSDAAYSGLAVVDPVVAVTDNDADFQINEIRVSHTSLDNASNNFLELYETGGNSVPLDGLTLVVIRSEAFGSNTPGEIVSVYSLSSGMTDAAGFFLAHDDGFAGTPDPGDKSFTDFDLIGGPMTYVVVSGFTGIVGQDLDDGSVNFADDGLFDSTPWNTVIDSITLDDIDGDTEVPPAPTLDYSAVLGGTKIDGLGDSFVLAAASALPDGSDTFSASAVDPFNDDSGDTPGSTNGSTDTTPPTITDVIVGSSGVGGWAAGFTSAVDTSGLGLGLSLPGADQLRNLPFTNMNRIYIRFSEDIGTFTASDVIVTGVNTATYTPTVTYNSTDFVAELAFASFLTADKIEITILDGAVDDLAGNDLDGEWTDSVSTVSGDTVAGGQFDFRIDVVPGDFVFANDSVSVSDVLAINAAIGGSDIYADINGSGSISVSDVLTANSLVGSSALPAGTPALTLASSTSANSSDSSLDEEEPWSELVDSVIGELEVSLF